MSIKTLWQGFWRLGFIVYLMLLSWQLLTPVTIIAAGSWDKLYHFVSFGVLAGLAIMAWSQYKTSLLVTVLIAYAALTEILQHFIVGRSFSIYDWLADCAGIVVATILTRYFFKRIKLLNSLVG